MSGAFGELLEANAAYVRRFALKDLEPRAARGLAVLTCIDSRIEPLAMLGLRPGDAKILRNAGARVTDDVLRALVVSVYLLGVERLMIVAHTDCRLTADSDDVLRTAIQAAGGPDTSKLDFLTTPQPEATLLGDLRQVRSSPYLSRLQVAGFLYDVDTGQLTQTS